MTQPSATLREYTVGCGETWELTSIVDLSANEYRTGRVEPVGVAGVLPVGTDLGGGGMVELYVECSGVLAAAAQTAVRELRAAWAPASEVLELEVEQADGTYVWRGRPLSPSFNMDNAHNGFVTGRLVFDRLDPLWYSADYSSASLTLAALTGGFVTPLDTPLTTTTAGGARDAGVSVEGSAPSPWSVSVVATTDLVDPYLSVDGVPVVSVSGTLPAGSVTVLDSRERSLRVDGYLRPWSGWGSSWRALSPGAHTLSLRASSGEGSASWLWRDAFY